MCFRLSCVQDICTDLQQHYIPVSLTLERCVKAKDDILRYYADIRAQIREGDKLYKVQSIQLKNKAECCRQQGSSAFSLCERCSLYLIKNQLVTQNESVWNKFIESAVHV